MLQFLTLLLFQMFGLAQMRRQYFHQCEPRLLPSFLLQWDQSLKNWTGVLIRCPGSWVPFDIKLIPCIARVLEHQESSMLILGKNEDGVLGYAEPFLWFDRCIQCPWDIASRNCPMAVKNVSSITFRFEWNHLTCNGYRGTHYLISWWWRKHLLPSQGQSPTNDTLDTLQMFGTILDTL